MPGSKKYRYPSISRFICSAYTYSTTHDHQHDALCNSVREFCFTHPSLSRVFLPFIQSKTPKSDAYMRFHLITWSRIISTKHLLTTFTTFFSFFLLKLNRKIIKAVYQANIWHSISNSQTGSHHGIRSSIRSVSVRPTVAFTHNSSHPAWFPS
jgi:hypothetical protein